MLLISAGIAAALIWIALVYATVRRLRKTSAKEREDSLAGSLRSAAWSDKFVESLLAKHPASPVLLNQYVTNARERQDWPEALRRAELFVTSAPSAPGALLTLSDVLRSAGRHDEAEAVLRRLRRRHPFNADVALRWARIPHIRSDWEESARRFAALRRRAPRRTEGYTEAADMLVRLGRLAEAETLIRTGMAKCPDSLWMWLSAAAFSERDNDPEVAVEAWEAFRARFPDNVTGFTRSAAALTKAGRDDEADRLLTAAIGFFPGNAEIARAIAASTERRGREAA
jgi:predicted Zn-dependent protease